MVKQNKEIEIKIIPRCNKCESTQTYLRLSTMERVCRSCGNIEPLSIEVNTKDKK